MKKFKINSIGFGYSRNIRWSEGLIKGGVAMIIVGLIINHTQTRWYVAGNQDSLESLRKVYDCVTNTKGF